MNTTQLALHVCQHPEERINDFKAFAEIIKPMSIAALKKECHLFWSTIMENKNSWVGTLFLPDFYRSDKEKFLFRDIYFQNRDAWSWAILYPEDVLKYFEASGLGVTVKENPVVRIFDKENKVTMVKNEVGTPQYTTHKPNSNHMLKSGFTYEQMGAVLEYAIVGEFHPVLTPKKNMPESTKKAVKTTKKAVSNAPETQKTVAKKPLKSKKV